jgi:CheY-like chemotaxis protein
MQNANGEARSEQTDHPADSQKRDGKDCAYGERPKMTVNPDMAVRKRILLVEDERLVRELIRLAMGQFGFTVVEANNGAEALGLFAQGRFDLVVTDFEMPFLKGNELAAKIRRMAPRQPILMITGFGHNAGPGNPVDAVIDKPLNFARLRRMMDWLLNGGGVDLAEPCFEEFNQFN